jgi:hypothetical protein
MASERKTGGNLGPLATIIAALIASATAIYVASQKQSSPPIQSSAPQMTGEAPTRLGIPVAGPPSPLKSTGGFAPEASGSVYQSIPNSPVPPP